MNDQQSRAKKSLTQMRVEALSSEGKSAWNCPTCGCRDFKVTNTWYSGAWKKRLRKCRNCGTPVTTYETLNAPAEHKATEEPPEEGD